MQSPFSYHDYVSDDTFMKGYSEYQKRYAQRIRESDRVMIDLVRARVIDNLRNKQPVSLLDIGCSTGNLLLHMKNQLPGLSLTGGDMVPKILDQCRLDPALSGVEFKEMNILDLGLNETFDVITANAVVYLFSSDELNLALQNINRALKPGGWFIAFDLFHPLEQDLEVFEKSSTHPNGIMLHLRPYSKVIAGLERNHLTNTTFRPFSIPVDLAKPESLDDITSHTIMSESGERMLFRGVLYQPWCFLATQKNGSSRA